MRLMLMRHAEAEEPGLKEDFARILSPLGELESAQAGKFVHEYQIDKILVSYVKRTMQTSKIIQEQADASEIEMVTELYKGTEEDIINLIASQEYDKSHLLVIGHNPLIFNVAMTLSKVSTKYDFLMDTMMPTARIVVIDFEDITKWSDVPGRKGQIIDIFTPDA